MELTDSQKKIIETPGNMIVHANAGTGKTFVMVKKIEKELQENKTHKSIAAITFTIKAAKEIRDRLSIDITQQFIGTNNSFAIEEIIKPFARDVFGNDYAIDMGVDYVEKINLFGEGLERLKKDHILYTYKDNKKDFIFELALYILKKSEVCKMYFKSKYFKLYLDEYQDSDKDMHLLFMYICHELNIDIFIVGDVKQSIYRWRGAYPEAFKSILELPNFSKQILYQNFRSCQQIQNYTNLLNAETINLYQYKENKGEVVWIVARCLNIWKAIIKVLNPNEKAALLRHKNSDAEQGSKELSLKGRQFVFIPNVPISDIATEQAWLYLAIASYCIIDSYSIYNFISEIPVESNLNEKTVQELKTRLDKIVTCKTETANFTNLIAQLFKKFEYKIEEDHVRKLLETISNKRFYPAFSTSEFSGLSMTLHSSKGLEFDQVIIFASDYDLTNSASLDNHYVAASRAKNKLIIVGENQEKEKHFNTFFKKRGYELKKLVFPVYG